jgi:hypothetical protein
VRYDIEVEDVENVVREEMEGPGQLLGYSRAAPIG